MGGVLIWRLIDVQLIRGQTFRSQAEDNRLHSFVIHPDRGVFLDRYGQPLVWNQRSYFQVDDAQALYHQRQPLSTEQAQQLLATNSAVVQTDSVRTYRYPEALAHALGYVGAVTADDLKENPQLRSDEVIGRAGLELTQERALHGLPGKELYEINAQGKRQRLVDTEPARPGQNVTTTFDPYLSEVAYQALKGQKGAVVIADAQTGELLSLVSAPSFNPNLLTQPLINEAEDQQRKATIAALFASPEKPFFNRAVSGSYPPGSVFKIVTALGGLETKAADASTQVIDEGVLKVGEYEYGNWYYRQYGRTEGPITIVRALARSNDIYFYKLAEWEGPDTLADYARLLGLGRPTEIQIPAETSGLVPDPAWKQQRFGEPWYLGNTYHFGIGQGDLLVSPVQVAQMMQAVANDGELCQLSVISHQPERCKELGLSPDTLTLVKQGLLDACSSGGTAFPFFPYNTERRTGESVAKDLQNGAAACKTGTAEFGGVVDSQGHRKTHGWFVTTFGVNRDQLLGATPSAQVQTATTPSDNTPTATTDPQDLALLRQKWVEEVRRGSFPSQLVIAVLVESDENKIYKEGSADAAPIAKAILDWMLGKQLNVTAPLPPNTTVEASFSE